MVTTENQSIRILLADDNAADRELFQEALADADINATLITVNDGEKLMYYLARANGEHPDIIFIDINMPCKNGKECVREIRSNNKLDLVPVVMFSISSRKEDIEETFASGANLYVSKPVFFLDEVEILKKIFSLNWREELLKPDRARFVLHTPTIKY
jgi:CheY-like chemotaxis protein